MSENQSSKSAIGKRYTQETLPYNLANIVAGQSVIARFSLIIFASSLIFISGGLAGFLGGFILRNLIFPPELESQLIFGGVLLLVLVNVLLMLRYGMLRGLRRTSLAAIVILIVLAIALLIVKGFVEAVDFFSLAGFLFFSLLLIPTGCLSLVMGGLAAFLGLIMWELPKAWWKSLCIGGIVTAAIICSPLMLQPQTGSLPENVMMVWSGTTGVLFGGGLAIACLHATVSQFQPLDFLKEWAIALGTLGSTSFKDLDLSGVDFSGARLANADLRARNLYRTNFQGVRGLHRAWVDHRCLDFDNPQVQKLLVMAGAYRQDLSRLNLQGAYLVGADLRNLNFTETNLAGADLRDADLRGAILVRAQVIGADFSRANLTGICIENWSYDSQTCFSRVQCDYIFRQLDPRGRPIDRYPADRNFDPQEFEWLYQELANVAEMVLKEGPNWRAVAFSLQKLQLEDDGLGLELQGIEKRGDRWVVKIAHNPHVPTPSVEKRLVAMYDEMTGLLAAKEEQIHKLLGIAADQAESIKELSQKPFGNSFFITGSTITNLTGSGQIVYTEAAGQVRTLVTQGDDPTKARATLESFLGELQRRSIATTLPSQTELIQQVIIAEAEKDEGFQHYLLQQGREICRSMGDSPISQAIQGAIAHLQSSLAN